MFGLSGTRCCRLIPCRSRTIACTPYLRRPQKIRARNITTVINLKSSDPTEIREQAINPRIPVLIDLDDHLQPPACGRWFDYGNNPDSHQKAEVSTHTVLRMSFWQQYSNCIVPLEITSTTASDTNIVSFERIEAPLQVLLSSLTAPTKDQPSPHSVYLAQHDLRDLPEGLKADLPTPTLIGELGKGDLYSSSLWLGKAPTYTPLHRDPNPNLFLQLAGTKTIRLLHPEIGAAVFEHVQTMMSKEMGDSTNPRRHGGSSAAFRGDEMMQGPERTMLHDLIWHDPSSNNPNDTVLRHMCETTVQTGQMLFIPQGWWHSVKGIGHGVTASANWWFR